MRDNTISIRPGVGILSVLQHLKYKVEFAFAEFIDNALDSAMRQHQDESWKVEVSIEIEAKSGHITIRDNAFGIRLEDFDRAFKPASPPSHKGGLSEFGMGMKSAACWFSNTWSVRTTIKNEAIEREVNFNVSEIVESDKEIIEITERKADIDSHYTVVTLHESLSKIPRSRALAILKRELASIYRIYLRNQQLILKVNGTNLVFEEPKVLNAAYCPKVGFPTGPLREWKYGIDLSLSDSKHISGFLGLREEGKTKSNGIYLFRRGRVIKGSDEIPYRPTILYGSANSFRSQRLFGELYLEGYDVTHTKDDFRHDTEITTLLEILKDDLNSDEFPLLRQAENYRARSTEKDYKRVLGRTLDKLSDEEIDQYTASASQAIKSSNVDVESSLDVINLEYKNEVKLFTSFYDDYHWSIHVMLSYDPSLSNLYSILNNENLYNSPHNNISISMRINMIHPYILNHFKVDAKAFEPIVTFLVALAISEQVCTFGPKINSWSIRAKLNQILTTVKTA